MATRKPILITGISGFVGKWTAVKLLEAGYNVRGTLRDMSKAESVHDALAAIVGATKAKSVSLVQTDLLKDEGWPEAMSGVSAVMHIATEVVGAEPKDPTVVIKPAVEGTRRVMQAALDAGVKRVVMTSSIATVGYGHGHKTGKRTYTDDDWTNLDNMRWKWAYCIGKTMAEREAWQFAKDNGMALTTIHPGAILGPATDSDYTISLGLVGTLLTGEAKAMPELGFCISDARDVADMHVAALKDKASHGQRYLATAPYLRFAEIADILRAAYPHAPVTSKTVPNWLLYILANFVGTVRQIINDIGNEKHYDGSKGKALMGHDYHDPKTTILDTAESLIKVGAVKI